MTSYSVYTQRGEQLNQPPPEWGVETSVCLFDKGRNIDNKNSTECSAYSIWDNDKTCICFSLEFPVPMYRNDSPTEFQ